MGLFFNAISSQCYIDIHIHCMILYRKSSLNANFGFEITIRKIRITFDKFNFLKVFLHLFFYKYTLQYLSLFDSNRVS